jgi:hypothetical protein
MSFSKAHKLTKGIKGNLYDDIIADREIMNLYLDSIQLAAAITAHNLFPVDIFVTSDTKLMNIAEKYFRVFNPG